MAENPIELSHVEDERTDTLGLGHIDFDALRELDALVPGSASRLVNEVIDSISHQRDVESKKLEAYREHLKLQDERDERQKWPMILGVMTVLLAVVGGMIALIMGRSPADIAWVLASFGALISFAKYIGKNSTRSK